MYRSHNENMSRRSNSRKIKPISNFITSVLLEIIDYNKISNIVFESTEIFDNQDIYVNWQLSFVNKINFNRFKKFLQKNIEYIDIVNMFNKILSEFIHIDKFPLLFVQNTGVVKNLLLELDLSQILKELCSILFLKHYATRRVDQYIENYDASKIGFNIIYIKTRLNSIVYIQDFLQRLQNIYKHEKPIDAMDNSFIGNRDNVMDFPRKEICQFIHRNYLFKILINVK